MNMRESALWKSFRRHLPDDAMAERIENLVSTGMPDVLLAHAGKTCLIELKAELNISRKQADWARRWALAGGTSWFLIAIGSVCYLVPGPMGAMLIRHPDNIYRWRMENLRAAIARILNG